MKIIPSQKDNLTPATLLDSMVQTHGLNAIQDAFKNVTNTLKGIGIDCTPKEMMSLFMLVIRHNGVASFIVKAQANLTSLDKKKKNLSAALNDNGATVDKVAERLSRLMLSEDDATVLRSLKLIVPILENNQPIRSEDKCIDVENNNFQEIDSEEIGDMVSNGELNIGSGRFDIDE